MVCCVCQCLCVCLHTYHSLLIIPGRSISARLPSENIAIYFIKGTVNCGFPGASVVVNLPADAGDTGDTGLIPGSGISPGEGNGNPLQYSCLENPMDRGWRVIVPGVTKSQTQLSN